MKKSGIHLKKIEKEIEVLFQKMDKPALKRLRSKIDFHLLSKKDLNITEREIFYSILKDSIYTVTRERIVLVYPVFNKMNPKFDEVFNMIEDFLKEVFKDKTITRNFRVRAYHLYCDLLIGYLKSIDVPIHIKTILNTYDRFLALFEKAFPGYLRNDIAHLIFDMKSMGQLNPRVRLIESS